MVVELTRAQSLKIIWFLTSASLHQHPQLPNPYPLPGFCSPVVGGRRKAE